MASLFSSDLTSPAHLSRLITFSQLHALNFIFEKKHSIDHKSSLLLDEFIGGHESSHLVRFGMLEEEETHNRNE